MFGRVVPASDEPGEATRTSACQECACVRKGKDKGGVGGAETRCATLFVSDCAALVAEVGAATAAEDEACLEQCPGITDQIT